MVKICGITNLEDAHAAVHAGATALGFNFWPRSPRYITVEAAAAIARTLPPDVIKAGVFVNETAANIEAAARAVPLDVAQLHGNCEPPAEVRLWRAVAAKEGFHPSLLDGLDAEAFLIDTPAGDLHGGTGRTFDWTLVQGAARRIVLAGGLDAENVRDAIRAVSPWGVDACSRLESGPGKKDHQKVAAFVAAALKPL